MGSKSIVLKLVILCGVTLLLCLALTRISWLVDERQQRQDEAVASVEQSQAGAQVLLGPLLQRHCTEAWDTVSGEGQDRKVETDQREFVLSAAPATLNVSGALNQESRYRGLFKVNGYAGKLQINAQWPSLAGLQAKAEHAGGRLQCDEPLVMLASSDARGLRAAEVVRASDSVRGGEHLSVKPGTLYAAYPRGLHALLVQQSLDAPVQLTLNLDLAGTQRFALVPAAGVTQLDLKSNWPHPSFGGRFLPTTREISDQGFTAQWRVSELSSTATTDVLQGKAIPDLNDAAKASVPGDVDTLDFAMVDPVNPYVMSDRAIKYGLMFIVLTFVCVGLVELLSGRRVHPVQYLFVGLALSVFFLLLLSLSEHLRFGLSYALAAGAAVLLLGHYGAAMLGGWLRGAGFGAGIAGLYAALYVLLCLEQASLLVGALLLFTALTAVMVLTRRLDWYAVGSGEAREA